MEVSPRFAELVAKEPSIVVLLDRLGTITRLNPAWDVGAEGHVGCEAKAVIGRRYLDFVAGKLNPIVTRAFAQAAALGPGLGSVWLHGECSTPDWFRLITTRITGLWSADPAAPSGYLVHHELRLEGTLAERFLLVERPTDAWRHANGLVVQCGCCRRVREPGTGRWEMSVALLERQADGTSHGLCDLCVESYYGEPLRIEDSPAR